MNQESDNPVHLADPNQALEEYIGEQFTEWMMAYVAREVQNWPELLAIKNARPKVEKIRKFMLQRYLAAEAFFGRDGDPGFLGFAIANLSESNDPSAESALEILEKKRQEEMAGTGHRGEFGFSTHKATWEKLLAALGLSKEDIARAEAKEPTRNYIAELSDVYSNSEWQTAVGAFAAHERSVPEEYDALRVMLAAALQIKDSDLEVLTWHSSTDFKYFINSVHFLEKIVFDPENKNLVFEGVKKQLQIRKAFYAGLSHYLEG
jgi:hypothetical protein